MKKYALILAVAFAVITFSVRAQNPGEKYAACAGDYFTAGVISAQQPVDDDKIYYTLLAFMVSDRARNYLGYDKSNNITTTTILNYMDRIEKNQDIVDPLVSSINKCDKFLMRAK